MLEVEAAVEDGKCEFILQVPLVESPYKLELGNDTREISLRLTHIMVNLVEEE